MTVHSSGEQIETVLAQLRAEQQLEADSSQQALLRHECGVLEELRGDEAAAAREYLAAFNTSPELREPLEALVRIYTRQRATDATGRGPKHLPKLLDTLVDVAHTPEELTRALWELANFKRDVEDAYDEARDCLERAVEASPQHVASWLELELLAIQDGDDATRLRAAAARLELVTDPTWHGLLLIELAELCAGAGELERASGLLDAAVGLDGRARYASRVALERIAAQMGDPELRAHACEGQAELIAQAIDDPDLAERAGVPTFVCTPAHAAEAWVRASELRRRSGDAPGALAVLASAAQELSAHPLVTRFKVMAADAAGEHDEALRLAREQIAAGVGGVAGSALWLRVGLAAQQQGDVDEALRAYAQALTLDPDNLAARTWQLDLLGAGDDAAAFVRAAEARLATLPHAASGEGGTGEGGRGMAWLAIASLWAMHAGDEDAARRALAAGRAEGAAAELALRLARSLASLTESVSWYEEATAELLAVAPSAADRSGLWFELARSRILRGDERGAVEALAALAGDAPEGDEAAAGADPGEVPLARRWLGRLLSTYAVGLPVAGQVAREGAGTSRDPGALERLAEVSLDERLGRGLLVAAAMVAARGGDGPRALKLLRDEHARDPGDLVVALFLAERLRAGGDLQAAAAVLASVAERTDDARIAGALRLESALLLWKGGDQALAITELEASAEKVPEAGELALAWALRSARPNDPAARGRVIALSEARLAARGEHDSVEPALERLALALATPGGDTAGPLAELDALRPERDLGDALALAHTLWPDDGDRLLAALARLEKLGPAGVSLGAAERYRLARFVDRDASAALAAARRWARTEPTAGVRLEWLGAALACDDRVSEVAARRALGRSLEGDARAACEASATAVCLLEQPSLHQAFLDGDAPASRLMNLELAPSGANPARRAEALRRAGDVLGPDAARALAALSAWNDLAAGNAEEAQVAFQELTEESPDDVVAWEGFRAASQRLGDTVSFGMASARLGALCRDDARAAEHWEVAGLTLLEHDENAPGIDEAFEQALARDNTRAVAFDKLFRRVRARKEHDRMLELIERRVEVSDDQRELTKMYWERARVLRRQGDADGALRSLRDVTMLDDNHVGALALAGEIYITKKDFAEAAPTLARLARLRQAPKQQRLMSGVAAVDLYEKMLRQPEKAVEVLVDLYQAGLSTPQVRERLARSAAACGKWDEATTILERLMEERESADGRAEAARLAMAIYRDKLGEPRRAVKVVEQLLAAVPDDREALELVFDTPLETLRDKVVPVAKRTLLEKLAKNPFDAERLDLYAYLTDKSAEHGARRAALGCLHALEKGDAATREAAARLDARFEKVPQIVLRAGELQAVADPEDSGAIAELFEQIAPTVSEALGPSLRSENVGRREKLPAGDRLRVELAHWMGALGFDDFDVYVGGPLERSVRGVAGESPALIVGAKVVAPFDAAARAQVARAAFALRRGTSAVLSCDDATLASIVIAVCNEAGVESAKPRYAIFPEVAKAIHKELPRRLRKSLGPLCEQVQRSGRDPADWASAARRSLDRVALLAAGDASIVIDDIVGAPGTPARAALDTDARARHLLSFALSTEFLGLRQKLGMGIQ